MKYQPITVTSQDAPVNRVLTLPGGFTDNHTYYPPEINPEVERVFPAPKTRKWKVAPPYDKSFKKVKQLREIKMTNYSVGEINESWYLAEINRVASNASMRTWFNCENGKTNTATDGIIDLHTYYTDRYDIIRAADSFPAVEYSDSPTPQMVSEALNDLKAKVVSDSYSGFDALTELAEFPETLGMVLSLLKAALRPIQGIKALREKYERARKRGKTHDEAHGEIASQWMQYRYGIMPLVYSIQDAIQLLDEAFDEFKTDNSFTVLRTKPVQKPISDKTHIAIYRAYDIKVTATGKARFATQGQRLTDLITANLFITAWELIPMSFVIDWFINVGDVITSMTQGISDLSEERKFCYSIRRSMIDEHHLRYSFTDGVKYSKHQFFENPCGYGDDVRFDADYDNTHLVIGEKLLYSRKEESYDRQVFQPNTVSLKFGPDLNWMRMLDGYVLSFNQIRKVLKSRR